MKSFKNKNSSESFCKKDVTDNQKKRSNCNEIRKENETANNIGGKVFGKMFRYSIFETCYVVCLRDHMAKINVMKFFFQITIQSIVVTVKKRLPEVTYAEIVAK